MSLLFCFILGTVFGCCLSALFVLKKKIDCGCDTSINVGDCFIFYDKKYPHCSGFVMVKEYDGVIVRYIHYSLHESRWLDTVSHREKKYFLDIYRKISMDIDEAIHLFNTRQYVKIRTF